MLAALEFHLIGYRRTWRASIFSSFLLPLLTVLSFGVGVGAYIDQGVGGVPYLNWIAPGLIASTALQVAIAESTWPVLSRFEWIKTYYAQQTAPLRVADILGGQLAYTLFRVLLSSLAFLLVLAAFGALSSGWAVLVVVVVVLLGAAVALPTIAFSASITNDSYLALLFRFGVIPMSLFAGVFFPVESLPGALLWLAYASPLWHGVELCRSAALGVAATWAVLGHLGYLAAWVGGGWLLANARFRHRLAR